MVVFLAGKRPNYASLVKEVAVDFCTVERPVRDLNFNELSLEKILLFGVFNKTKHTILLDSELVAVLAEPRERNTVKAAAKCLKASVSGPPPATAKSCRSRSMEAWLLPEPLVPVRLN